MIATDAAVASLTPRQSDVLDFMRRFAAEHGTPPTFREIGEALAIRSPNGVRGHLNELVRKGAVRHVGHGKSRNCVPVSAGGCCPACGRPTEEA